MQVLSIQSHVTYGHVGNAAIQLPLQLLGIDVLPIHTTLLSSHKGYPAAAGSIVPADNLRSIIDGLAATGTLGRCDAILSGYLGAVDIGAAALDAVRRVKTANPDALYCCDPVFGDHDKGMYVGSDVAHFLRDSAIAAADIITPNLYELSVLTDRPLQTDQDVAEACATMRRRGPQWVLVTSLRLDETPATHIDMQLHGTDAAWVIRTPVVPLPPTVKGTGDLIAALFTAHLLRSRDPRMALEQATSRLFAVLSETARVGAPELRLVDAREAFLDPPDSFGAKPLE